MMNTSSFMIFVLYINDILFTSNDISLLNETTKAFSQLFDIKDLGDAFFMLGIKIHHDRSRGLLNLSQKSYVEKVLKRFNMITYFHSPTPI